MITNPISLGDLVTHSGGSEIAFAGCGLVQPELAAKLSNLSHRFPFTLASGIGVECQLGKNPGTSADLAFRLDHNERRDRALVASGMNPPSAFPPTECQQGVLWSRVAEFATHNPNALWLEFDLTNLPALGHGQALPAPGVFFPPPWRRDEDLSELEQLKRLLPYWRVLRGVQVPVEIARNLGRFVRAVRNPLVVFQFGVMLDRNKDWMRCCVVHRGGKGKWEHLPNVIKSLGWTGDLQERLVHWQATGLINQLWCLHLDIGPCRGERLGLEFTVGRKNSAKPLLENLVALGVMAASQAQSILDWSATGDFVCAGRAFSFRRRFNHVKLSVTPSASLGWKAYFGIEFEEHTGFHS